MPVRDPRGELVRGRGGGANTPGPARVKEGYRTCSKSSGRQAGSKKTFTDCDGKCTTGKRADEIQFTFKTQNLHILTLFDMPNPHQNGFRLAEFKV